MIKKTKKLKKKKEKKTMKFIKFKTNFSFPKLLTNLDKIVDNTLKNATKSSTKKTKLNVSTSKDIHGAPFEPLADATLGARQRGIFWEGDGMGRKGESFQPTILKSLGKTSKKTPLQYSGNLLKSIKSKNNKMTMAGYGKLHHEGYDVSGSAADWKVPARPFIQAEIDDKTRDLFVKDLEKNLKK